jgi:hypothetical protein
MFEAQSAAEEEFLVAAVDAATSIFVLATSSESAFVWDDLTALLAACEVSTSSCQTLHTANRQSSLDHASSAANKTATRLQLQSTWAQTL